MQKLEINKFGRIFYGLGLAGMSFQQFFYADFRLVFLPLAVSAIIPALNFWVYIASIAIVIASIAIIFDKNGKEISLVLGGVLLLFFVLGHLPYELFFDPNNKHLGTWINALKELALSGGAFVVAGSFIRAPIFAQKESFTFYFLEKIIPFGKIFFSITMIIFGISHFIYPDFVVYLIPNWIPFHLFWTYFSALALIGSGVAIVINFKQRLVSILLGTMLFLWFILLHIPRAMAEPFINEGNEITSVFQALAFSGIAFLIANGLNNKKRVVQEI
jgi:uncharacterized membrane protein YphA (DoxX/SURF4 family)